MLPAFSTAADSGFLNEVSEVIQDVSPAFERFRRKLSADSGYSFLFLGKVEEISKLNAFHRGVALTFSFGESFFVDSLGSPYRLSLSLS